MVSRLVVSREPEQAYADNKACVGQHRLLKAQREHAVPDVLGWWWPRCPLCTWQVVCHHSIVLPGAAWDYVLLRSRQCGTRTPNMHASSLLNMLLSLGLVALLAVLLP